MKKPSKKLVLKITKYSLIGAVAVAAIGVSYWAAIEFWLKDIDNLPYISYRYRMGVSNPTVTIVSVSDSCPDDFVIPPQINGYVVTDIANLCFKGNTSLRTVTLPSSITTIGDQAFADCTSLSAIYNADSVANIGSDAFANTAIITNAPDNEFIVLGSVIIGYKGDFPNNTALISTDAVRKEIETTHPTWNIVDIGTGYTGITNSLFIDQDTLLFAEIPSYLSSIPDYLFQDCDNLSEIRLSENTTVIGKNVFDGCSNLSIDFDILSDHLVSIGNYAFRNTAISGDFVFPSSISSLGTGVFSGCSSIDTVSIPSNSSLTTIGDESFYGCTNITSITLNNNITLIGSSAFYGTSITSFDIPRNISTLKESLFQNCIYLEKVTAYNEGISEIQANVFKGCSSLRTFMLLNSDGSVFPGSVEGKIMLPSTLNVLGGQTASSIGSVFSASSSSNAPQFSDVEIPYGVSVLGESTFLNNIHLRNISFGYSIEYDGSINYGLTSIGASAFRGCVALDEFISPSSLTTIANQVFKDCTSITKIVLPQNSSLFGSIEASLFENCVNLSDITIPSSVATIKARSFAGLKSLEYLVVPSSVHQVQSKTFAECEYVGNPNDQMLLYMERSEPTYSSSWPSDWIDETIKVYWSGEWHYDPTGKPVPGAE